MGHFLDALINVKPGDTRLGNYDDTRDLAAFWLIPNVDPFFGSQKKFIHLAIDTPQPLPINAGRIDPFLKTLDPLSSIASPLRNVELWMRENLSLRNDLYDLLVLQRASTGLPGQDRGAVTNRFNWRMDWKAWEIQGLGTGSFTAQFRANNNWSSQNVNLSNAIGSTAVNVDTAESAQYYALSRLFVQQGFFDDRVLIGAGKINPNDTTAANFFAGDETNQFLASVFNGGDALPVGWNGVLPGVYAQCIPADGVYVNAILTSPLGASSTGFGLNTLNQGLYFAGAEAGFVTALGANRELVGRYSIFVCNTNAGLTTTGASNKQYGSAMAIIAQQFIDRDLGVWFSYQLSDANVSAATQEFAFGASIENSFGRYGDNFGIALGWTDSSQSGDRNQKTIETYYRIRLTGSIELSPDVQIIFDPSNPAAKSGATWVFGLRTKIHF